MTAGAASDEIAPRPPPRRAVGLLVLLAALALVGSVGLLVKAWADRSAHARAWRTHGALRRGLSRLEVIDAVVPLAWDRCRVVQSRVGALPMLVGRRASGEATLRRSGRSAVGPTLPVGRALEQASGEIPAAELDRIVFEHVEGPELWVVSVVFGVDGLVREVGEPHHDTHERR